MRKILVSAVAVFALLFALNSAAQASHFGVCTAFATPRHVTVSFGYALPVAVYALPPVALPTYAVPNVTVKADQPTVAETAPVVPVQPVFALPVVAAVPSYGFSSNVFVSHRFGNTIVFRSSFDHSDFIAGFRAGLRADNLSDAAFRAGFRAGLRADGRDVRIGLINIGR